MMKIEMMMMTRTTRRGMMMKMVTMANMMMLKTASPTHPRTQDCFNMMG